MHRRRVAPLLIALGLCGAASARTPATLTLTSELGRCNIIAPDASWTLSSRRLRRRPGAPTAARSALSLTAVARSPGQLGGQILVRSRDDLRRDEQRRIGRDLDGPDGGLHVVERAAEGEITLAAQPNGQTHDVQ